MALVNLFLAFFRIGLFAVGGAYSFLPLIEKEAVEKYHWLSKAEFLDISGISTMFPGAISVKFATYIGYKVARTPGLIFANLGNILAPLLLIIFASVFYVRYKDSLAMKGALNAIRVTVFAMIVAVAFRAVDLRNLTQIKNIVIVALSFIIFLYTKIHPAAIIVLAAIAGIIWR